MKQFKIFAFAALLAFAATGLAQSDTLTVSGTKPGATVSVEITDPTDGTPLATAYGLGALSTSAFTYGADFTIKVTYGNANASAVALSISGSQADYDLVYKFLAKGTTNVDYNTDVAFGSIGSSTETGGATEYLVGDNDATPPVAFNSLGVSGDATKFSIGAKARATAAVDLGATITITATIN